MRLPLASAALLAIAFGATGAVTGKDSPLSSAELSRKVAAESASQQIVEPLADGRIRMTAPLQDLEARIGLDGAEFASTDDAGSGRFSWAVRGIGRTDAERSIASTGHVRVEDGATRVERDGFAETFTASADGLRHEIVVEKRPSGRGALVVEFDASVGMLASAADPASRRVDLRLADGRVLTYGGWDVTDALGEAVRHDLVIDRGRSLRLDIADDKAVFPLRVAATLADADWSLLAPAGFDDSILAMVVGGSRLYVGGFFTVANGGTSARNVAAWDGSRWTALGTGTNRTVLALAWDETSGRLYAGGRFTEAGGVAASGVAVWDGAGWSALGAGLTGEVHALTWDGAGRRLYAGGDFSGAGGDFFSNLAAWDGARWQGVGATVDGRVAALAWDAARGHLYAGGDFRRAGSAICNGVAVFRDGAWHALGEGTGTGVHALAWDSRFGRLFAGGNFVARTQAGDANRVAVWEEGRWVALGQGVNSRVLSLAWDEANLRLYVGGEFTTASGNPASSVAMWSDFRWTALGAGTSRTVHALAWDAARNRLHVGGSFTRAANGAANRVASWNGSAWLSLGPATNGEVSALLFDSARGRLFAGGSFDTVDRAGATSLAMWNGNEWARIGGTNGSVADLAMDGATGRLYVGGFFTAAGGVVASNIASWDGVTWQPLGTGVDSAVRALEWDAANGRLYAGGGFRTAGGAPANHVAQWNGSSWAALGTGTGGVVSDLLWEPVGRRLYVGGSFESVGGISARRIALWDGSAWSTLGSGIGFPGVSALAWDAANGHLYAGGDFITAGDVAANNIAMWNGSRWSALGSGTDSIVSSLAWDATRGRLLVGGLFTSAGGIAVPRLAVWDRATWIGMALPASDHVNALAWDSVNRQLFAAGVFRDGAGTTFRVARARSGAAQTIDFANPGPQTFGTASSLTATASSGLPVVFSASTPATCTVTPAGMLSHVAAGPCTVHADQSGNADVLPAPRVSQTFTINAIAPGAPIIGIATAGDAQATVTFTAPVASGGAPITVYTATSSPGDITAAGASSPLTVLGLTNGVAYTFTVRAANSAGSGAPSAQSNSVTPIASAQPPSSPIARPDRLGVVENGVPVEINVLANDTIPASLIDVGTLSITRAPTLGTASVLTRGTASVVDDRVSYVVPANASGWDSLVYRLCFGGAAPCVESTVSIGITPISDVALRSLVSTDRGHRTVHLWNLRPLSDARYEAHGLVAPVIVSPSLSVDATPESPFDAGGASTTLRTFAATTAARDWRVFVDARSLSGGDVDVYLGPDTNGSGQAESSELSCASAMSSMSERCELAISQGANAPAAYWVLLHSRSGAQNARAEIFEVPLDVPVLQRGVAVTGPTTMPAGVSVQLRLVWNDATLAPGQARGGWLQMKSDANTTLDWAPVRLDRGPGAVVPFALPNGIDYRLALAWQGTHDGLFVDVPPGTTRLNVTTTSAANVDLYFARVDAPVASGATPTVPAAPARGLATSRAVTASGNESLAVDNPAPGRWYVTPVNASDSTADLVVRATLTSSGPQLRPGGYFNPARSGNGLFVYPAGSEWAALWYTYLQDGTATWYYLQAPAPGPTGVWRVPIYRSAWNGSRNHLTPVGEATITPTAGSAFTFSYTLDGETGSEAYQSFGGGCPSFAGAPLDISGHWFDPAKAGTGYSVQLFPNYEFYLVFGYDAQGVPRYLVAEREGIGAATDTLTLEQNSGACPLCNRTGNPVRRDIGTLVRTFGGGTLQRIQLNGIYTSGIPGVWAVNDAVIPLGSLQGCSAN